MKKFTRSTTDKLKKAAIVAATLLTLGAPQQARAGTPFEKLTGFIEKVGKTIEKVTEPIQELNSSLDDVYRGINTAEKRVDRFQYLTGKIHDDVKTVANYVTPKVNINRSEVAEENNSNFQEYDQQAYDNQQAYNRVQKKLNQKSTSKESSNKRSNVRSGKKVSSENVADLAARLEQVMRSGSR